jgi:hypothetical protein
VLTRLNLSKAFEDTFSTTVIASAGRLLRESMRNDNVGMSC